MEFNRRGPHSLGKSVEWKLECILAYDPVFTCPHSLGKSVEWKLALVAVWVYDFIQSPLAGEIS